MERNYEELIQSTNAAMLEKLKENEHKPGFDNISLQYALERINAEWKELRQAILDIINIRVERLQSISGYDAAAEGIKSISEFGNDADCSDYMELWESINGSGSWDKNPWVWVVEFRRVL